MPVFSPFRGFLYDRELVPHLEDVIAPPYDVIDDDERASLLARHPWNAAHLDVGEADELGDRYGAAGRRFEAWSARGILRRDPHPSFYLYRIGFRDADGHPRQMSGVLGAVTLEEPGRAILPHERTLSKPLGDRLDLMRACTVNVSPIWLLSPVAGLTALLEPDGPPRAACSAPDGSHHRIYDITAGGRLTAIEEAVAYRDEVGERVPGAAAVMALVVELSPDQLQVQPIHRLVRRRVDAALPGTSVDGDLALAARLKGAPVIGVGPGRGLLADPPPPGDSAASHLHETVLPLLGVAPSELEYEPDAARVVGAVASGGTGFFLPPVTIDEIAALTGSGGRFPEKTTFFAPKPRTGLVFRSLTES